MGIFDAFKKKENDEPASFVLGVEDRFALLNTKDIVVVLIESLSAENGIIGARYDIATALGNNPVNDESFD